MHQTKKMILLGLAGWARPSFVWFGPSLSTRDLIGTNEESASSWEDGRKKNRHSSAVLRVRVRVIHAAEPGRREKNRGERERAADEAGEADREEEKNQVDQALGQSAAWTNGPLPVFSASLCQRRT